ncbi:Alpha/Beta hydrolase protein [Mycena floridula]|nr:Alpha/Beta hydrolase protein [Mycena floridula]
MTILPWPFKPDSKKIDENSLAVAVNNAKQQPGSVSLLHYSTPGKSPPSARVDSSLKLAERRPVRLWHLWKYGFVAASKATELAGEVVYHHIWGPRKRSWGIEMTLITSLMRGAGRHSHLVDIATIRTLMSIGGLVPLPSDALVTPVTFRVRKRRLGGILAPLDAAETGHRELSGEWVVGKKTWQRLQSEWKATQTSQRSSDSFEHSSKHGKKTERVILYIHGGAYYLSSAAAQRVISIPLSKYTDARVFALDYRLAPETRFPGPLHDVVSAYFRLLDELHIPPENIIVSGDSAGGGLTLALLMYLRDNSYPLPSGAILMSPWVDLTMSCESWDSNAPFDVVPIPALDDHMNPVALYLGENLEKYLTHPYVSPLFGDFEGLPPLLVQSGDAEVLRDEITLLAHKASLAGVEVRHELYEDAVHVFQLYPFLKAAGRSFMSMRDFVHNILPQLQSRVPQMLDVDAEKVLENEIDNESACVVRGDGTEVVSGKEEVKGELQGLTSIETSDSDEDEPKPSWGHSSWSLNLTVDDDDSLSSSSSDDEPEEKENVPSGRQRYHPEAAVPARAGGFRRIRSAISLIMTDPLPTPGASRRHRRTLSSQLQSPVHTHTFPYVETPVASPVPPTISQTKPLPRPSTIDLPPNQFRNIQCSLPPSPSVRRSSNAAHSNHPDISNLVFNWTNSGPANQTLVFSPSES